MKLFPALAALTLAVSPAALSAQVQPVMQVDASSPLITLTVQEEVQAAPSLATISAGVTTQAATASEALRANAQKMNAVVAELKKRGIAGKDIQTSSINLNPQYNYNNREGQPPTLTGYQASNMVTLQTRDLDKIGELLDALVAVGGNNINGPNFSIEDDTKQKYAARDKALQSAQTQANFYAQRSGYKTAKLVSITEGVAINRGPMPVMMESRAAGKAADFAPVEPGEVGTGVTLTIQYRLEN